MLDISLKVKTSTIEEWGLDWRDLASTYVLHLSRCQVTNFKLEDGSNGVSGVTQLSEMGGDCKNRQELI